MGAGGARRAVLALRPALEPACSRVACSLWSLGSGGLRSTRPTAPRQVRTRRMRAGSAPRWQPGQAALSPPRAASCRRAARPGACHPEMGHPVDIVIFTFTNAMHEHEGWGAVAVLLAAGACPRRAYGRANPGGPCAELGRRVGRRAQVHRLSTDFRKATRIVTARVPSAAELPAGARSTAIISLARSGGAPGRLHGRPRARLGVLCCRERRATGNVP